MKGALSARDMLGCDQYDSFLEDAMEIFMSTQDNAKIRTEGNCRSTKLFLYEVLGREFCACQSNREAGGRKD